MEGYLAQANSGFLYLLAVIVVAFILVLSVVFLLRAYRRGIAIGMDRAVLRKAITSSAAFTVVPSIGILLGVIALSGSLGVPIPWIRLSVIGALHYETMAADVAAKAMGLTALAADQMSIKALITMSMVMTVGIVWGAVFCIFGLKRYERALGSVSRKSDRWGALMFAAMFIGLVSAYVATSVSALRAANYTPLVVMLASAAAMAGFQWLIDRKGQRWLESFALSFAMLIGMAAAVLV